jgi:hypothetical protein
VVFVIAFLIVMILGHKTHSRILVNDLSTYFYRPSALNHAD